jgi:hypothetical protein
LVRRTRHRRGWMGELLNSRAVEGRAVNNGM